MFKRLKQNKIYEDKFLKFYQDEIQFEDGSKGTYAWVNRKNGAIIVVATKDNKILLNNEYRHVIESYNWEIPGGGIDEGETPEKAATRELEEETGIKVEPSKLKKLGLFYPLNSFNTESITAFYIVIGKSILNTPKITEEFFKEQKYFSFTEILKMIDNGELSDTPSANAIQMVIRRLTK